MSLCPRMGEVNGWQGVLVVVWFSFVFFDGEPHGGGLMRGRSPCIALGWGSWSCLGLEEVLSLCWMQGVLSRVGASVSLLLTFQKHPCCGAVWLRAEQR